MNRKKAIIVGVLSPLGRGVANIFARNGLSVALVDWSDSCRPSPEGVTLKQIADDCRNSGAADVLTFTGKLNEHSEWRRIFDKIISQFRELHYFIYLDGLGSKLLFAETNIQNIRQQMDFNFVAPATAITCAIEHLAKTNGQVAIIANSADGEKEPSMIFYNSSKSALKAYLTSIHQSTNLFVTYIYPGFAEYINTTGSEYVYHHEPVEQSTLDSIYSSIASKQDKCAMAVRQSKRNSRTCPVLVIEPPFNTTSAPPLCAAVADLNKMGEAKDLLKNFKKNPDMITEKDASGRCALHYAANSGNLAAFDLMVSKTRRKSNINIEDNFKFTPLHFAAMRGNLRTVKRLLKENGDPNILTKNHMSPLHYLARCIPKDQKSEMSYLQTLKALVDVGADTNQKNYEWATPVHEAARAGSVICLDFLLKNEGDIHRKTRAGATPLQYAIKPGNEAVIKVLLEAGADPTNCFEAAQSEEKILTLLEKYREKNRRAESDSDGRDKEIVQINSVQDLLPQIERHYKVSEHIPDRNAILNNVDIFLYVLRFLSRKIYVLPDTPLDMEKKRVVQSRAGHGLTMEEASEKFILNGNPRKLFKIMEDCGRGGFGSVVVAKRLEDKKRVAVKRVPHFTKKEIWNNLDEVYFLSACANNCIVKYYNSYISRDELWMIMEYMEGGSLSQVVEKWNLTESQICFVTQEILKGLSKIHGSNMVHRDLKSANVMLSIYGDIKIIDFGLCAELNGNTVLTNMVGSPFWIPPEMIKREEHGPPADIWSLAILCLEMANGKPPHRVSALKAMFNCAIGNAPTLDEPSKWSEEFRNFLDRMLKINPKERASAAELLKDPWMATADTKKSMREILHQVFVEKSLESSLGITI